MSKQLVRIYSIFLILTILFTQFGIRPVAADATFNVNSGADLVDANLEDGLCATDVPVVCTLRAAIQQANALGGADTISVPADVYTLTIEGADEDAAATGDLDIIGDLTITGAGATVTILDPNDLDRALHVVSGSLTISDLKVQNGTANPGGALKVDGNAVINRVAFVNNESPSTSFDGTGGGIYVANSGSAVISESSFSGNLANYGGGAVASSTSAVFTITDSTFDGNFGGFGGGALYPNGRANSVSNSTFTNNNADTGGAIHSNGASVTVTNSTFVGNSANNHGAIDSRVGQITVQYSTFYNNSAGRYGDSIGSQAYGAGGTLSVGNSILYGTSFDNCDTTDGFVTDLGNNLSWPSDNNCPGTRADPLLDTNLANNGGPTQTLALLPGSPALNAGNAQTCPDTDQRGETRPQGAGCDIGPYEAQVVNIFRVTNTNDSGSGSLRQAILNANATLNIAGGSDQIRFAIRAEGVQTISPLTELPLLSEAVVIDGYTQPGSSPNTLALGNNANIQIELNGDICSCARGLWISVGSTVRGLAIRGGFNNGIEVNGSGSTITGNFISVRLDDPPEGVIISGIYLNNTSNNTVGGSAPADRNVIALNAGTGVSVSVDSGTGNLIRGNNIFSNDSLGIDLAHDEVTFNHAFDPELSVSGPNNYQNFPVLTVATSDGETLRVGGLLESEPNQNYTIDVFSNETCDPTFFGEGKDYVGSFTVTTDANGQVIFDTWPQNLLAGTPEPHGISATATGSSGTSEFSYCRPVATSNLNWVQAQSVSGESQTQQYITDIFQEKWFKFPVQPGSTVSIKLTSLPGSAVSLHRDPNPIYETLIDPQNAELLSAEASDAAFLPSGSLPSGSLPSGSLPSGSLPSGSLPSGSLPTGYLPSGSLPSGSLPSGSLPSGSLPSGSLPSGSLPSGSLPSGSLPSGSLPSGSLPSGSLPSGSLPSGSLPSGSLPSGSLPSGSLDAYASAAVNSLMGISMDPYATVQTIERNTYDLQENLYVRVVGPYNLETQFTLEVMVESEVCVGIDPMPDTDDLPVISGSPLSSGSYQTLILTDSARLHGEPGEITAALDDLDTLAARSDVNGIVIDLNDSKYLRVSLANTKADAHLACAAAKNTVAKEIKKVINAYRAANPTLEYIVLAGGADVIPFFQVQDVSGLANEKDYVPPVLPSTASEAGLKTNLVQGQDAYGSQIEFTQAGYTLALPDLAVGRLVDSATEISAAVDAYIATDGVIVPNSSLVTGYDFVGDAAVAIQAEMEAGTDSIADTLIQAPGLPPTDASAWTANQLRTKLLGGNFDIAVLTGHFSAGNLLAADYATELSAAEIEALADMTDVLVLALGCHGGYSIPNSDLLTDISPNPDWARAFLANGAAGYVSATGYAYGDTELVEYGERLFLRLAQQLRTGSGPVSVGQALVKAKQQFLAETAQLTGIDQKTLVEMTLYGLPMMKVDMPGVRLNPPTENSIVSGTSPVLVGPGASFGLRSSPVVLNPVVNTHTKILQNLSGGGTVTTTHLSGVDGVVVNPFEPIYPKEIFNVTSNGNVLRGVALRGGTYTDLSGIIPLTSSPTTETSTAHLSFNTDVFYPTQTWASNFSDAINGGNTRLIVFPAQFKSSAPSAIDGILRKFNQLDLQFYYLPDNWTDVGSSPTTKAAAVSAAPVILGASGVEDGNTVKFSVNAAAEGSAGVQAVWVLYTGKTGSSYHGMWAPLDLTQNPNDPTLWEGTLTLQSGENAEDILFMVQAVGGAGLTTLATNLGAYYSVADENATQLPPPAATTLTLQSPPASGTYLKQSSFDLLLQSGGQPLAGRLVTLDIGGQQVSGSTNSAGEITLTLNLVIRPGNYTAQASFRGNAEYLGSNDASDFTVNKDSTTLTVTPASASVMTSQPTPFVAVVRDSSGRALGGKSVFFIVHNSTETFATSVIADFQGNAALGVVPLPAGVYTVDAYFNGTIPVNPSINLSDDYYESSSRLGLSLELKSFDFTGFFDPVKNPPIINQMKAGQAVPLKFSLGGDQGLAIFATGFPQSRRIQCDTLSLVDSVEETLTAGSSSLSYNPTTGLYTYVWKTEKSWAGTCRQVTVRFIDGQTYTLNFKFVR